MSDLDIVYPSVGFYFQVKIDNETYNFKEVSGISLEVTTDEISEGGENRFKYRVPNNTKYTNLELKRGLVSRDSLLMTWITESLNEGFESRIKTKTIEVSLLNAEGDVAMIWQFLNAWPVAWSSASLNAMSNEVLVESISFSYNYFTRKSLTNDEPN